jgi:Glycosyltransferase WbsX
MQTSTEPRDAQRSVWDGELASNWQPRGRFFWTIHFPKNARLTCSSQLPRRGRSLVGSRTNLMLYWDALAVLFENFSQEIDVFPCVIPNWGNTARFGVRKHILNESTPHLFQKHLRDTLALVESRPFYQRLVFVKAWNEWAERNHLESDQKFGLEYLASVQEEVAR